MRCVLDPGARDGEGCEQQLLVTVCMPRFNRTLAGKLMTQRATTEAGSCYPEQTVDDILQGDFYELKCTCSWRGKSCSFRARGKPTHTWHNVGKNASEGKSCAYSRTSCESETLQGLERALLGQGVTRKQQRDVLAALPHTQHSARTQSPIDEGIISKLLSQYRTGLAVGTPDWRWLRWGLLH
jgi:hypothetical protein